MSDPAELLSAIVELLGSSNIPYMVVGSFASTFHGQPRTTQDLDLVIDPTPAQLDALLTALDPDRFYVDPDVARDALRRLNVIEMTTAWKLDLVMRKDRPFSVEELARRTGAAILGVDVAVATAEDTILAKLEWAKLGGSDRQLDDVAGILRVRGDALDHEYLERWIGELGLEREWNAARDSV